MLPRCTLGTADGTELREEEDALLLLSSALRETHCCLIIYTSPGVFAHTHTHTHIGASYNMWCQLQQEGSDLSETEVIAKRREANAERDKSALNWVCDNSEREVSVGGTRA